jgi:hypothetical protein
MPGGKIQPKRVLVSKNYASQKGAKICFRRGVYVGGGGGLVFWQKYAVFRIRNADPGSVIFTQIFKYCPFFPKIKA